MKREIENIIDLTVEKLGISDIKSNLEHPVNDSFGEWTSNIAFILSSRLKKNPRQIAESIVEELEKKLNKDEVESISIEGAGYINIKLKNIYYFKNLLSISENYGYIANGNPLRIMVEFGQPNTHKIPHIGHLFSYISGNSISNILKANGHEVLKVNYQGDVGLHVAKCLYAWIKKGKPVPDSLDDKVKLLQESYQEGNRLYKNDEDKEEIHKINKAIYDPNSSIQEYWKKTRQWSLDYYIKLEKNLNIDQKIHYLESAVWETGFKNVKENIGKVFEESEGAIIFPGEKYGLHTRVFITKNGIPTYEAKDLGLCKIKMDDWPYDLSIITTASEQNEYFKVVIEAISQTFPNLKDKVKHIGFGMINLSSGKMNSREGNIISAVDLIELVVEKVRQIISERGNVSEEERERTVMKIALGAIKYAFLKNNIVNDSTFNIDESISLEGNSGPYLLYTYVRILSILKSSLNEGKILDAELLNDLYISNEEINLAKILYKFPEIVSESGSSYSPHRIAVYLFNLAQAFNLFYTKCPVNSAESENLRSARRMLIEKTSIVLLNGLELLGIETVDKM